MTTEPVQETCIHKYFKQSKDGRVCTKCGERQDVVLTRLTDQVGADLKLERAERALKAAADSRLRQERADALLSKNTTTVYIDGDGNEICLHRQFQQSPDGPVCTICGETKERIQAEIDKTPPKRPRKTRAKKT